MWLLSKMMNSTGESSKKHCNWKEKGTQDRFQFDLPHLPTVFQNIIAQKNFSHLIPE